MVAFAVTQEPFPAEPDAGGSAFQDLVDVAAIAIPLALIMLVLAMTSSRLKRWFRHHVLHRGRRRRRRSTHEQQALAASALPTFATATRMTPGSVVPSPDGPTQADRPPA